MGVREEVIRMLEQAVDDEQNRCNVIGERVKRAFAVKEEAEQDWAKALDEQKLVLTSAKQATNTLARVRAALDYLESFIEAPPTKVLKSQNERDDDARMIKQVISETVLGRRPGRPRNSQSVAEHIRGIMGDRVMSTADVAQALGKMLPKMNNPRLYIDLTLKSAMQPILDAQGAPIEDENGRILKERCFVKVARGKYRVARAADRQDAAHVHTLE